MNKYSSTLESLFSNGLEVVLTGEMELEDWVEKYNINENFSNIDIASGATKICFIFEDLCVKVSYKSSKYDCCKLEYENYLKAKEKSMEQFFPKTWFLDSLYGRDFYAQELVECDYTAVSSELYKRVSSNEGMQEEFDEFDRQYWDSYEDFCISTIDNMEDEERVRWLFEDSYSYEEIDELLDFLYDNEIDDLHEGNFGFLNGKTVICDFSGYWS